MLFTIIIPVYNAEHYLHRCLDSILSQSTNDTEIILINDGSVDGSADICNNYSLSYSNVIVFHQDNRGVSAARNQGLLHSTGQYIMFVDSDDSLTQEALDNFRKILLFESIDILQFGFNTCNDQRIIKSYKPQSYKIFNTLQSYSDEKCYFTAICGYVINRKLIFDHTIIFTDNLKYAEDQEFILKCFFYAKKICTINKVFYNYYDIETSVMHKPYAYSRAFDTLAVLNNLLKMYPLSTIDIRTFWNNEIRLLFENYFRTLSKLPFSYKLLVKAANDMNQLYETHSKSIDIIFGNFVYINKFAIACAIYYLKIKIKIYFFKVYLLKICNDLC